MYPFAIDAELVNVYYTFAFVNLIALKIVELIANKVNTNVEYNKKGLIERERHEEQNQI